MKPLSFLIGGLVLGVTTAAMTQLKTEAGSVPSPVDVVLNPIPDNRINPIPLLGTLATGMYFYSR